MKALFTLFTLVCASTVFAQTNWEFDITDKSHSILIPSTVTDSNFEIGDYLGVFYEDGGELQCAGYTEISEGNLVLTAFGASFSLSGFQVGQVFHFKHWSVSTELEQDVFVEYNNQDFPNTSHFVIDGMSGVSSVVESEIWGCTDPEAINFDEMSSYNDGSCISVFQNLYALSLDSITDLHAEYNSELDHLNDSLNTIIFDLQAVLALQEDTIENQKDIIIDLATEIDYNIDSMYVLSQIIDALDAELNMIMDTIDMLNQPIVIELVSGWNTIGYYRSEEMDLVNGFLQIEDIISIVKDNNGNVYWPSYNFNGIGNLIPGQGYQLKISDEILFSFPTP